MIRMVVDSIREGDVRSLSPARVVILREAAPPKDADFYYLAVFVNVHESNVIAACLSNERTPRPLMVDAWKQTLLAFGARVKMVVISNLFAGTFYADLIVDFNGRMIRLDCRPSDAMALALRMDAQIFAEEKVLAEAGIRHSALESSKETGGNKPKGGPVSDKELKDLSAFRNFIEEELDMGEGDTKKDKP